jgi:Tfp pilus assembly protein PilF
MLELAVTLTPASTAARALRDEARREVVATEYREGVEAFQRRQLDDAIAHWDRALEIDPDHRDAQINRAQAIELKSGIP